MGRLPRPLLDHQPPTHAEPDEVRARRRRVVTAVVLGGAGLLGLSLSSKPDSRRFYVLTMAVAGTWTAGALGSGPLHRGWIEGLDRRLRRPLITPVVTGVGAFALFYAAALLARRIPLLDNAIGNVLRYADQGSTSLVTMTSCANGVAEELFFRGAVYAAAGDRHPVATSTIAYTAATAATRNPALTLAGTAMGVLFGLQRRASGGVQAPVLTHLTWSLLMLRFLPPLFRRSIQREGT
jgi:membrane protease YdiL (CAAX protease family)